MGLFAKVVSYLIRRTAVAPKPLTPAERLLCDHVTEEQWLEWRERRQVTFEAHGYRWMVDDRAKLYMLHNRRKQSFCFFPWEGVQVQDPGGRAYRAMRSSRVPIEDVVLAAILFVKATPNFPAQIWRYRDSDSLVPTPRGYELVEMTF